MNLFVFQQKNFFVEWKKKLETEGRYYYWRYSRCASNDEAKNLSIPVISQHANRISKTVKDKDGYWYGYEVEKLAIAINKERWNEEIAPLGLSYPLRWKDLLNPIYKGKIVMPDPNVSGTAYTFFQSLIDTLGEEEAKGYVKNLAEQVGEVTVNGYIPAELVASGEYMIGINFMGDQRMLQNKAFRF